MDPFGIFMAIASMALSAQQASSQQKVARRQAQAQMDRNTKEQWAAFEKAEKERKKQLKRAVAKRRARMGAQGFSAADGSAGALIQGLRNESATQSNDEYSARKEGLDRSFGDIQSNLLRQSEETNRRLYKKAGSTAGSIAGGLIGGDEDSAKIGEGLGSLAGDLLAQS